MRFTTASLVATCALAQRVTATYDWGNAKPYSNPSNTDNECTPGQKSGFDWSDLPTGSFSSYRGLDFSGFHCSWSDGRRSLTARTGSRGKHISCKVGKDSKSSPKISDHSGKGFSITVMQLFTSYDTEIDFIYDMPDGSSCKHTQSCSKSGSSVKNTQCGGAVAVSFQIPQHGSAEDCDVGVQSISFDCQPASTPSSTSPSAAVTSSEVASEYSPASSPVPESSPSAESSASYTAAETSSAAETSLPSPSSQPAPVTSSAAESAGISSSLEETPIAAVSSSAYSSEVESPPAAVTTSVEASVPMTTLTVWTTFISTAYSCSSDIPNCPASSTQIVTMTTAVSTTICPVTSEEAPPIPETSQAVPETSAPAPESMPAEYSTPAAESTPPLESTPPQESSPIAYSSSTPVSAPGTSPDTQVLPGSTPETSEMITTEMVYTTSAPCPVTITSTSDSYTVITTSVTMTQTVVTATVTVCTKCSEVPPTTLVPAPPENTSAPPNPVTESTPTSGSESVSSGPVSSPPPAPPVPSDAPCPEVLPSCLNTWLSLLPKCTSNSDASCYCPSKKFTDAIVGCVQAWGASADEMSAALSYFAGICAASIPENPGIITAVPTTITIGVIPSAPIGTGAPPPYQPSDQTSAVTSMVTSLHPAYRTTSQLPVTVISYTQTLVPVSGSNSSVMTGAVTVPQVSFVTNTAYTASAASGSGLAPQVSTSIYLVPASSSLPGSSGAYNGTKPSLTSSGVPQATGAAAMLDPERIQIGVAVIIGLAALLV